MPIDPSIPLQVRGSGFDPIRTFGQLAQLTNLGQESQLNQLQQVRAMQEIAAHQRQNELAERQLREKAIAGKIYVESEGDLDKTIASLRKQGLSLDTILLFEKHRDEVLKSNAEIKAKELPGDQDKRDRLATLLETARQDKNLQQNWPRYASEAAFIDPRIKDRLPAVAPSQDDLSILSAGFKTLEWATKYATQQRAAELHTPALAEAEQKVADTKRVANATRLAGILRTQGPAAYNLAVRSLPAAEQEGFQGLTAEKDVLNVGRTPQEISQGYQAAMPQQAEDWIAIAKDPNAPPERKQYAQSVADAIRAYKIATQPPPIQLLTPDAEAQRIRIAAATAAAAAAARAEESPATEAENRSLGFFERAESADKNLELVKEHIANKGTLGMIWTNRMPNPALSEKDQQYHQARTQFIEAYLRRDSGANITPSEYANADKTFFPQAGDGPQVLKDKAAARKIVVEGLKTSAGRAYTRKFGATAAPPTPPPGGKYEKGSDPMGLGLK